MTGYSIIIIFLISKNERLSNFFTKYTAFSLVMTGYQSLK